MRGIVALNNHIPRDAYNDLAAAINAAPNHPTPPLIILTANDAVGINHLAALINGFYAASDVALQNFSTIIHNVIGHNLGEVQEIIDVANLRGRLNDIETAIDIVVDIATDTPINGVIDFNDHDIKNGIAARIATLNDDGRTDLVNLLNAARNADDYDDTPPFPEINYCNNDEIAASIICDIVHVRNCNPRILFHIQDGLAAAIAQARIYRIGAAPVSTVVNPGVERIAAGQIGGIDRVG